MTAARSALKRVPGLVAAVGAARGARTVAGRSLHDVRFVHNRPLQRKRIDAYLREHTERKLQLGTGSNPYAGWLNTDVVDFTRKNEIVYMNARKPFPLPDASFDVVFSEHMIEHMPYTEGLRCLAECHRVLRPGGRIRIATPTLDRLVLLYEPELSDLQRRYIHWSIKSFIEDADVELPGFVVNNFFQNWGHEFIYDQRTLRHALETVGFEAVEAQEVGKSEDPRLAGLERHMRSAAEFNAYETMALEARRP